MNLQKQQNSLIAGLRATNEALLKQELAASSMLGATPADVTSGTSNGSLEKKDPSPECQDPLASDHTKEATPSTSKIRVQVPEFFFLNLIFFSF